jgi:antitoxin Phd
MVMEVHWPVQDAKQRFSELLRRAESDGAQFITRHGTEVAVIVNIEEYRHLTEPAEPAMSFKDFLLNGPKIDAELEIGRTDELPRKIDFSEL